ncbi:MAG: hypothetical protein WCL50_16645 [Spirochaetota bacterium]
MKHKACLLILALSILLALPLAAQGRGGASLGLVVGGTFPGTATTHIPSSGELALDWGFFVNLPLLQTFHIAPSAELYKFSTSNATDFDLAFKFIVPLNRYSIFVGISPGLTTVNSLTAPHVGLLAGASFGLVSNLDAFAQGKYTMVFDGNQNMTVFHLNLGVLFNF